MNINMNEVPATFPEMVEAMSEAERARERVRDLQPVFCVKPYNEMRHDQNVAKKAAVKQKAAKAARKKNRPAKKKAKAKKGKKK